MTAYIGLLCQMVITITFAIAVIKKFQTFEKFKDDLATSFNLTKGISTMLALKIIVIETFIALTLFSFGQPKLQFIGLLTTLALLIVFTLVLTYGVVMDKVISCNCFGESKGDTGSIDVLRNTVLIIATIGALNWFTHLTPHQVELTITSIIALSLSLIIINLDNLILITKNPKG